MARGTRSCLRKGRGRGRAFCKPRPEYHPDYDVLHVGELGDATNRLIELLDASVERPAKQIVLTTAHRTELDDFPIPAYHLVDIHKYMVLTIQWSSGCPYTCDFCDIPALYGHHPRMKSVERLIAELDVILSYNPLTAIFWVDDNLIGNKKTARELLPKIAAWQRRTGYRLRMGGQCTINVAQDRELLAMLREAYFVGMYFGIESPNIATLKGITKHQNIRMPILDAVKVMNSYGIELNAGFIFGMDADGENAADEVIRFVREAAIPMTALNVIWALPKTALWQKLEAEGRIIPEDEVTDSNVVFKLPSSVVINQWKRSVAELYEPSALYARYRYNIQRTYPNQKKLSLRRYGLSWRVLRVAGHSFSRIFWICGVRSNYKREFWKLAWELLRLGQFEHLTYIVAMSHHLIGFRKDVMTSNATSCFYTTEPAQPAAARDLVTIR